MMMMKASGCGRRVKSQPLQLGGGGGVIVYGRINRGSQETKCIPPPPPSRLERFLLKRFLSCGSEACPTTRHTQREWGGLVVVFSSVATATGSARRGPAQRIGGADARDVFRMICQLYYKLFPPLFFVSSLCSTRSDPKTTA